MTGQMIEGKAGHTAPPSVPFGPQSIAGYTFSFATLIAAVLAFIEGDRSEQTVGTIVFGVASLIALVVTSHNRTRQAVNLAQLAAPKAPFPETAFVRLQRATAINDALANAQSGHPAVVPSPPPGGISSVTVSGGDLTVDEDDEPQVDDDLIAETEIDADETDPAEVPPDVGDAEVAEEDR
jgi:hypothetical protein